ncbi:HAMP domain-containing sensor histidine kinase [Micromonospora sp. 4G57]|uniref:histidine kinase n=1 Tax=Micromonospora sicca TaxID=2202420 RepID=A0A317DPK4_9ACTN|nr:MULTISPECIES: HAMP domain-containing sensor histidine kinase [unclassified Micromonospora]MBM0226288.1 HAMP domain-containing histidine kinase [Micromonospora sp. ATA51]MDZ5444802.1 HAMP domain-containing sensor histidine kinase [Micromonospora sp. 4G57]MDZ5491296.1 HAMP domain-containing sensor histidine kinase [Micromonospora sp. 4G53]PWR16527.1 two-component sensor histidine kinase [Micromonospora sp. 4G51]
MSVVEQAKGRLRSVPLRIKLVASVLALVAAALVVISLLTAFFLQSYLVGRVDSELDSYLDRAQQTMPTDATTSSLPSDYMVVTASRSTGRGQIVYDKSLVPEDLPGSLNQFSWYEQHADQQAFTTDAADKHLRWRVMVKRLNDDQFIAVGQNMVDVDLAVKQLVWIDLLVGGAVLILLASVGAAIVRTSLKPLVEIERTAAAIAGGDLTRRVPDPEEGRPCPTSELGRLSRALNAMLAQIEAAFTARAASETAARSAEVSARDAAAAAQASEARARRSEERMRQFVADASHELRTPLTTIRGFAELYRQGAARAPEQTAGLLRRIEDEAARMGLLVEDLLLLARLDRERPITLAPVELPVLASDAVQAARAVAPDRRIELDIEPGAGTLLVHGDDARLRQVIGNLMTNALTHTPPDASVTLRLRTQPGNLAVVEVADTGPGLTPEQAERVFERFYRADAARTRRATGVTSTGLGLAIVAALVGAHHGTVEVAETPGGGATFRVKLPLLPDAPDEAD